LALYKLYNKTDVVGRILTCTTDKKWMREFRPTCSSNIPSHPTRCRNKDDLQRSTTCICDNITY